MHPLPIYSIYSERPPKEKSGSLVHVSHSCVGSQLLLCVSGNGGVVTVCLSLPSDIRSLFVFGEEWGGLLFVVVHYLLAHSFFCSDITRLFSSSFCFYWSVAAVSGRGLCYVLGVKNGKNALECSNLLFSGVCLLSLSIDIHIRTVGPLYKGHIGTS